MARGDWAIKNRKSKVEAINTTLRTLTEREGGVDKKWFIASLGIDWGCSNKKILEYVQQLEDAGFIKTKEDLLIHMHPNTNTEETTSSEEMQEIQDILQPESQPSP